jgi:hypothetical protein
MASVFKNELASCVDATATTAYTIPASTTSIIIGANLANTGAADITVDVAMGGKYIVKGVTIPVASALSVLDGKIVAESGQSVAVQSSSATGDVDIILSVLEQS